MIKRRGNKQVAPVGDTSRIAEKIKDRKEEVIKKKIKKLDEQIKRENSIKIERKEF